MAEAWYKEWCPHCDTHNWICNGDEQDICGVDVEGIKCRKCGKIFPLGEIVHEDLENINWEDGLEAPK